MARSVLAAVGVALLALVLAAAPCRADIITVNTATQAWLELWIKAIPNLQAIWLNPVICARSGIECVASTNSLNIRLDAVTSSGFNYIGTLPEVPDTINGTRLQVTGVSVKGKTRFTGTVPASWSKISRLTTLDVSNTKLSGLIPDSLTSLSNLVSADFSSSYFCYGMPNWNASGMPALTQAKFNNNNMRGTFASSWSTFPASLSLSLTGNKLCGCIPPTWTNANLIAAAKAMDSASVSPTCTRVCSADSLSYCPVPGASGNGASSQVAVLSAVAVAVAVAAASLL